MASRDVRPTQSFVDSNKLPDPQWYSHAASIDGPGRIILTSGQTAQHKDGSWPETFPEQVRQALANLSDALQSAGAAPKDIVKLSFYVVDWDVQEMGLPLVESFLALLSHGAGYTRRPVTTLIPVPKLAFPEAKFEIEAMACVNDRARPWSDGRSATTHAVPPIEVDVVVVGGGFSGLMAATEAQQAGLNTILLEAKHRVGGRSRTQKLKSGPGSVELGATWINKTTQPTIYGLTQKFGLETSEQYVDGLSIYQFEDGTVVQGGDDLFAQPGEGAEEMQKLVMIIHAGASAVNIHEWDDFPADEDLSFIEWMKKKGVDTDSPRVQAMCSSLTTAVVGREPDEVGAQYFLDYIQSGFGYESIVSEGELGAQSLKIKTGTSSIATSLASTMRPGSIILNCPVDAIQQSESGSHPCLVTTAIGDSYKAKKVIMANPTNTYTEINFTPPLPSTKRSVVNRTKPGIYAKVLLTYTDAWWKKAGLVGKVTSFVGPICFGWDVSDDLQNSLAYFISGNIAAKWHEKSELEREEAIIEHLAQLVGPELADKARDVLEVNYVEWTKEPYIWGAPTCAMGPGLLKRYGKAFREPVRNLHFAGGEFGFEWKGYLEGALTSGQRAAKEVITLLCEKS
ncbi:Amine oxidase [Neofusicoccum parvum]|nr:Amine oxidase [Neofusicoccum parvum]